MDHFDFSSTSNTLVASLVKGITIGFNGINISHLQFADDTIIFCEAELNCTCQKLPLKYLGMLLGANPSRRGTWKPVVEKFKKKLIGWKRRLPGCVGKEIDKIQQALLCGDFDVKKKVHLVKWKDLTKDKRQGGLGIRNLRVVNNSLLAKWWWRFGMEDNSLWKQFIYSKYKSENGRWFLFHVEWSRARNQNNWAFNFKRPLLAWKENELQRLHDVLGKGSELRLESNDSVLWKANLTGIFSVKCAVNWSESSNGPALKLSDLIWHNPLHLKPNFSLGWSGKRG
ncbi:uncharacterized protein LOC114323930 [Camellia sinensis]|uniref:uncharacterized protein LOC114323930 n=1 Tax=Camellia sinensis TaxID=4442 RepID=UPI0010365298|nr:uncharacterized protein LOC114323930 [Camellia sinensis]